MSDIGLAHRVLQNLVAKSKAEILLLVPPFAGIDRPSLGVHLLQAAAERAGFRLSILYTNLLLANRIGYQKYETLCYAPTSSLVGEKYFSVAAFANQAPTPTPISASTAEYRRVPKERFAPGGDTRELSIGVSEWCDEIANAIAQFKFDIVGSTSTFEQTCASVALLSRVKSRVPETITIIGGANCEGEMAEGVASLKTSIDYIFSGESEATFIAFLEQARNRCLPEGQIICGTPNYCLDDLPIPDYDEYYAQVQMILPDSPYATGEPLWLPFESSRGCWWGQKHHCTFCGINGQGMPFRQKSPDRVLQELRALSGKHPSNKVVMVDNIMPHDYFTSLLPRMPTELPGLHLFYEQKANLTLPKVSLLKEAGIEIIQPGIEALSTPLLQLMKKGVTASQNVRLLRYACSVELAVNWNLLFGFPGDSASWYEDCLRILPSLFHLAPPNGLYRLSIDRFSPYFNTPQGYGITETRPMREYPNVFPIYVEMPKIAYHFEADYRSGSLENPEIIKMMAQVVDQWRASWQSRRPPKLLVSQLSEDQFVLYDSRSALEEPQFEFISRNQASVCLAQSRCGPKGNDLEWALSRAYCTEIDGEIIPLCVASAQILQMFEHDVAPIARSLDRSSLAGVGI